MRKRSSNDIKKVIIFIVILMLLSLIGLIVFLFSIDVKMNNMLTYDENSNKSIENIQDSSKNISLGNYDLVQVSSDGSFNVILSNGKTIFKVIDKEKFQNNFTEYKINMDEEKEIDVKENIIQDIFIGKIDKKDYLFVITDKGSIGVMEFDEAIKKDEFRIDDSLISFEKEVVRFENANVNLQKGNLKTVVVFTSDGLKYDLSDFVQ